MTGSTPEQQAVQCPMVTAFQQFADFDSIRKPIPPPVLLNDISKWRKPLREPIGHLTIILDKSNRENLDTLKLMTNRKKADLVNMILIEYFKAYPVPGAEK
ncbi:MAG: hypothetical protein CSYNP_01622 [Syntrophus sp. SKADARSKE-3]|nr:hypothetical protein [Syntrophus sp. SKADARSKE-3]